MEPQRDSTDGIEESDDNSQFFLSDSTGSSDDGSGSDSDSEAETPRKPIKNCATSKRAGQDESEDSPLHSLARDKRGSSTQCFVSKYVNDEHDTFHLDWSSKKQKEKETIGKTIKAATLQLSSQQAQAKRQSILRSSNSVNLLIPASPHSPISPASPFSQLSPPVWITSNSEKKESLGNKLLETVIEKNEHFTERKISVPPSSNLNKDSTELLATGSGFLHNRKLCLQEYDGMNYLAASSRESSHRTGHSSHRSSLHATECPPERIQFYKTFSSLIRVGSRKHRGTNKTFARLDSQEEQLPHKDLKDFLWLELMSWHSGCSMKDYDKLLCEKRNTIPDVLKDILNFSVQDKAKDIRDENKTDNTCHLQSDSVEKDCTDYYHQSVMKERTSCVLENCQISCENVPEMSSVSASVNSCEIYSDQRDSFEFRTLQRKVSEDRETKTIQSLVESLEKAQIDMLCSDHVYDERHAVSPTGQIQENSSNGTCLYTCEDDSCECSDTLSRLCQTCINKETDAMEQVSAVLEKVDKIEHLYPCTKSLCNDYADYQMEEFTTRIKTLNLWLNITRDLRQKIVSLAKLFNINDKELWPCYDRDDIKSCSEEETKKTKEEFHEKKRLTVRTVHFMNVPSEVSSPSSSGSDRSERSKNSVPPSPEVQGSSPFDTMSSTSSGYHSSSYLRELSSFESSSLYRNYVDKALRHKGLRYIYSQLTSILRPILYRVHAVLKRPKSPSCSDVTAKVVTDTPTNESTDTFLPTNNDHDHTDELATYGVWSDTYQQMGLPTFYRPFLFLLRVPLDVVHECLRLRLAQQPDEPSILSIGQLLKECKEVLKAGIQMRQHYFNLAQTVLGEGGSDAIEAELDAFDEDLKMMLEVYLAYLERKILMMQKASQGTLYQKVYLEEEWAFVRATGPQIPGGVTLASKRFCGMACSLLRSIGDFLESDVKDSIDYFHHRSPHNQHPSSSYRKDLLHACWKFKVLFFECSKRTRQTVAFAKTLRKDFEIAAEFKVLAPPQVLLHKLKETGHIRVIAPHCSNHVIFVPGHLQNNEMYIWQLVDMTCGHENSDIFHDQDGYLIMMRCEMFALERWRGPTIILEPTAEANIILTDVEVEGCLLVVNHASQLIGQCRKFQKAMDNTLQIDKAQTACNHAISTAINHLKVEALELRERITRIILKVEEQLDARMLTELDESDRFSLQIRFREVLHEGYKFGFEYHKVMTRLITGEARMKLGKGLILFAYQWMKFVAEKCEHGRGFRTRWASQGLEFLISVCEPQYLQTLTEEEFQNLKDNMNKCASQIIGSSEKNAIAVNRLNNPVGLVTGRASSHQPSWSRQPSQSRNDIASTPSPLSSVEDWWSRRRSKDDCLAVPEPSSLIQKDKEDLRKCPEIQAPESPLNRVKKAIDTLEDQQQTKLRERNVIGQVSSVIRQTPLHIGARRVTFPWQRGFKIGEGRFGKVYTAVNNVTGELIAMKEIRLQPNDHRAIKETIDEIRTFEGIKHSNLVRYYGVEIHREEMLIFMEYCNEGSIESAAQFHLPETLVRKYTRQLLDAVNVLHEHGIVHRDIKSANIFLTSDGSLKLGDFGCSIKLNNHTTMPGELCGFVGTPAYMAPEIFTRNIMEGHGRAVDIWSVGCVVLELASGQRPWHDLENSYQIMFRVGMGETPDIPDTLSEEGQDFLNHCLQHSPRQRWTASQLLGHVFTKVNEDDDS